jgi:hypothetical protein
MSAGPNVVLSTGRGRMAPVGALSSNVCQLAATTSQRHSNSIARRIHMFIELDTRRHDGFTVSLEWDRDTGQTQIVINDARAARESVFEVANANAADAFRHPFRYAP